MCSDRTLPGSDSLGACLASALPGSLVGQTVASDATPRLNARANAWSLAPSMIDGLAGRRVFESHIASIRRHSRARPSVCVSLSVRALAIASDLAGDSVRVCVRV